MSKALLVARRELAAYLRSWLGWVAIAASLFLLGAYFMWSPMAQGKRLSAEVLRMFFDGAGFMVQITSAVLSMRLIAREREAGTLVLLGTAPIRDRDVVIGKFVGAFALLAGLVALTVYMPLLVYVNGKVSIGHVVAGYVGVLLLGAYALAVGVFASSLASSQVVSVVIAVGILGALMLLSFAAGATDPPIKEFVSALSPYPARQQSFMQGKIEASNVVYYLGLTYFFLLAAVKSLEARRWR
jgi:ABC-2 type transport system permease protein